LLHIVAVVLIMWLLSLFNIMQFPAGDKVYHWDSGWYYSIVKEGYNYQHNAQCNLAFFPLFPFIWKWAGLGNGGISILNCIFLLGGLVVLAEAYQFSIKELLFYAATPSLMFCFVPYSEAIFFLSASLLLAGLKRKNLLLSATGIFIAGLARSVSLIFFAAVFFIALAEWLHDRKNWKRHVQSLTVHLSAGVLSVLCVAYIQWRQTGMWFYFLQTQQYWGKEWGLPKLPLVTWGGAGMIWLDGAALFIALTALGICLYVLYKSVYFTEAKNIYNNAFGFSIAYLGLLALITLFYGIGKEHTHIYSINRYIFATPFFTIFIFGLKEKNQWRNAANKIAVIIVPVLCLAFGIISFIMKLEWIEIAGVAGFIALSAFYLLAVNEKIFERYFFIFYVAHVVMQLKLYDLFLNGKWVG
jgi:hypothetical protein